MKYIHTKQHGKYDCGLACVSSVLKFYGFNYGINYLTDLTSVKQGYTLKDLVMLFRNFESFACKPMQVDVERLETVLENITTPFIAHVTNDNEGHYVVVYKKDKNKLIVSDPNSKKLSKLLIQEFKKNFTGILLLIEPIQVSQCRVNNQDYRRDFFKIILKRNVFLIGVVFVLSILFLLATVINSFFFKLVIDHIIPKNLEYHLMILSLMFLGINLLRNVIDYMRTFLIIKVSNKIDRIISEEYFKKLTKLPIRFFENRDDGEIISRFNDAVHIRHIIGTTAISAVLDLTIILGVGIALYKMNSMLFLTTLVPLLMLVSLSIMFYDMMEKRNRDMMQKRANTNSFLVQFIKNMPTIYSLNKKKYFFDSFEKKFNQQLETTLQEQNLVNKNNIFKKIIQSSASIFILWIGAQQIIADSITIGDLLFINSLVLFMLSSLDGLIGIQSDLQKALVAGNRFFDILDYPETKQTVEKKLSTVTEIQIDDLSYSFCDSQDIIKNVNLKIYRNEKVLFVGASGTGKSTLSKILVKFYNIGDSKVCMNGIDINELNNNFLRNEVVYLDENSFLFKGTIQENLCMGKNFSMDKIIKACKEAEIYESIISLSNGFDFHINERASNLSTGQKQRLSLARALLQNPSVLILDESISNVDLDGFANIYNNLMKKDCIVIFITHNPDVITNFDRKFIFRENTIIEVKEGEESHRMEEIKI
ncbi:peptidase domain-containing ABC transporter [Bacillus sp. CDB3]|uniref:peptidase domain-containing ABC transporter n=1 Tax=Bacillus sp. CDB3 TaxID=360310 RepID=UPI0009D7F049|nr:peptidase domain-containing ABC transporter [Bacillus sp. CDB3]OQR53366.1 ABC transporter ATP-binding protein [Bacillus sp. CDB3]